MIQYSTEIQLNSMACFLTFGSLGIGIERTCIRSLVHIFPAILYGYIRSYILKSDDVWCKNGRSASKMPQGLFIGITSLLRSNNMPLKVAVYVHAFSFSTNSSLMGMNLYRSISYLLTFGHTSHWSVFTQSVDTLPFACSLFNQGIFDGNKLTRVVHAIRIHY